jgi:hypothetical protein
MVFLGLAAFIAHAFWSATRVDVELEGIADGTTMTSSAMVDSEVRFRLEPAEDIDQATLRLDGEEVPPEAVDIDGPSIVWRPGQLPQGRRTISLAVPRFVLADSVHEWKFVVDDSPPQLTVPMPLPPTAICDPVELEGRVEPGSELFLDGQPLAHDDGRFTTRFDQPPARPLMLTAIDRAGNETRAEVIAPVHYPGAQGVHVTAAAWAYPPLRQGILDLIDQGRVSAVELDLKDEGGTVGYDSNVPLAHQIGAVRPEYELESTVAELKRRGVRVIGRVVAFRDRPLATWAWDNGHRDWVVQTRDGQMLDAYGGFTNFAHEQVRQYNLDIALEGVSAGMDDILWDYVRRPEGAADSMVFPGLKGTPSDGVVGFLAMTGDALRERCAYQGASVFGIAADRPDAVGQPVSRIARHVDYVAPMLYPSHWVKGEYGVDDPNGQPYDIVTASLADFRDKVAGTGTRLVPWIQDFSLGHTYGAAEVQAQIRAAHDLGVDDYLLWNAGVRYTADALPPSQRSSE